MAELVAFPGGKAVDQSQAPELGQRRVCAEVVSALERMLAAARAGEIQLLGYVGVRPDSTLLTGIYGEQRFGTELNCGANLLNHRVCQMLMESATTRTE